VPVVIFVPRSLKVFVATQPVNLRKSFDGLSNEAREMLHKDPLTGHILVFINRRKNQVKLLMWTRGGFTIMHKRLERGTFASLREIDANARCVETSALARNDPGVLVKSDPRFELIAIERCWRRCAKEAPLFRVSPMVHA
jgi:transposase